MTSANCGLVRLAGSALETNRDDYMGGDKEHVFPADRDRDFGEWAEFRLGQLLELHPAVERLAEVGSGTGHFLEAAAKRGIFIKGFDLSDHRKRARDTEFEVSADPFARLGRSRWDAVVAFHVLEHCADPLGAVQLMLESLCGGGIAFVEVPGILEDAPPAPNMIDLHHQWYFSETTLRRLIEHAGGDVVAVSRVGPTIAEMNATASVGQKLTDGWQTLKRCAPDFLIRWLRNRLHSRRVEIIDRLASLKKCRSEDPRLNKPLNLCIFFRCREER